MSRMRGMWLSVFIEALVVALAEGLIILAGWLLRRLYRWYKKRKKRRDRR